MFLSTILLLIGSSHGFSGRLSGCRHTLQPLGLGSERSSSFDTSVTTERRNVLASIVSVTSLAFVGTITSKAPFGKAPSVDTTSSLATRAAFTLLPSVDEAIALIESSCDRRFLHAVVASDYHLMYRGSTPGEARGPSIRSDSFDLLLPSTYDSKEASDFFASLDEKMQKAPVKPSNGHLSVTSIKAAKEWGGDAVSIWPLGDDVHFAWLEEGNEFWSEKSVQDVNAVTVIVDGVDCGRMSLEDALESDNKEILFRADQFLAVPVSLEQKPIDGLRSAFII